MEWHEFPEGEEPVILTGVSNFCSEGKHAECPGLAKHGGETIFCICNCHEVPHEA